MGSVITEDGNTVYKYAKDILSYCSNRTDELIARLGKAKEPVKFGLPPSVGSVFFSNVLLEYNEKYPQIDLQIFEGTSKQIEAMIVNSQLDLGVVVEPYENPDMELKTVFRSDAVLAVGKNHRLAKRKSISFAELDSEPMVWFPKNICFTIKSYSDARRPGLYRKSRLLPPRGIYCWRWWRRIRASPSFAARWWKGYTAAGSSAFH